MVTGQIGYVRCDVKTEDRESPEGENNEAEPEVSNFLC